MNHHQKTNHHGPDLLPEHDVGGESNGLVEIAEEEHFNIDTYLAQSLNEAAAERLDNLVASIDGLSQYVADLQAGQDELNCRLEILADQDAESQRLRRECQQLREQHYEREQLGPVLRLLIALADRCQQGIASLRELRRALGRQDRQEVLVLALDARKGDLVEIESLLATYGVEPFRHTEPKFAAGCQRCVQQVPTSLNEQAQQIAERVLPGYRRGTFVLRPEYVAVYVLTNSQTTHHKERAA